MSQFCRYGYYDQAGKLQVVNYTADPEKVLHRLIMMMMSTMRMTTNNDDEADNDEKDDGNED